MDEMDEMRRANAAVIENVNSTKTFSGGSPPRKTPDEVRADNAAKLARQDVTMKAKAKAQQAAKRQAWEAKRTK